MVHHPGDERRNLKEGPEAEGKGSTAHWLAPHGVLSLLYYTPQDHLLRDSITTAAWAPPTMTVSV